MRLSRLGKKHSEATLAKFRARKHSELALEKLRLAKLGWNPSETTREKLRLSRLGKKHSEATLAKLRGRSWKLSEASLEKRKSIVVSEATRQLRREAMLGRKHTEATLAKLRGRIFKHSEATREKMRGRDFTKEHRSKLGLPVIVTNIRTGAILEYGTMTEAGNALGVTQPLIKKYLLTGDILKKTYYITSDAGRLEKLTAQSAVRKQAVLVKNIETGEIVEYTSMAEAGRALDESPYRIKSCMKKGILLRDIFSITNK